MISRNKISNHKDELYSKRRDIINWYEEHSPNDGSLWKRWDEFKIKSFPLTYLNRFSLLGKLMNKVFSKNLNTYKGEIRSKSQILSNYNFSFTYENIENIEGYISEKMTIFSLTIPIHRGATILRILYHLRFSLTLINLVLLQKSTIILNHLITRRLLELEMILLISLAQINLKFLCQL